MREKEGRAHGSGPLENMTLQVLGHRRSDQYKLLQKPPPLGMSTSSKWASAPSNPQTTLQGGY